MMDSDSEESEKEQNAREDEQDNKIYIPFLLNLLSSQIGDSHRQIVKRAYDYLTSDEIRSNRNRISVVREHVKQWYERINKIKNSKKDGTVETPSNDANGSREQDSKQTETQLGVCTSPAAPDDELNIVSSSTAEEVEVSVLSERLTAVESSCDVNDRASEESAISNSTSNAKCLTERASADSSSGEVIEMAGTDSLKSEWPTMEPRLHRRDSGTSTTISLSDDECMVVAEFFPGSQAKTVTKLEPINPSPQGVKCLSHRKSPQKVSGVDFLNSNLHKNFGEMVLELDPKNISSSEESHSHKAENVGNNVSDLHPSEPACDNSVSLRPLISIIEEGSDLNLRKRSSSGETHNRPEVLKTCLEYISSDEESRSRKAENYGSKISDSHPRRTSGVESVGLNPMIPFIKEGSDNLLDTPEVIKTCSDYLPWVLNTIDFETKPHCTDRQTFSQLDPRFIRRNAISNIINNSREQLQHTPPNVQPTTNVCTGPPSMSILDLQPTDVLKLADWVNTIPGSLLSSITGVKLAPPEGQNAVGVFSGLSVFNSCESKLADTFPSTTAAPSHGTLAQLTEPISKSVLVETISIPAPITQASTVLTEPTRDANKEGNANPPPPNTSQQLQPTRSQPPPPQAAPQQPHSVVSAPVVPLRPNASHPSLCGLAPGMQFQYVHSRTIGESQKFTNCMYCNYLCTVSSLIEHFVNNHSDVDPPSYLDWKNVRNDVVEALPEQAKAKTGVPHLDDLSWIPQGSIFLEVLKCKLCTYTEKVRSKMLQHVQSHRREKLEKNDCVASSNVDRTYLCRFCDFTCCNGDSFRNHCTEHTGEYMFTCGHCSFRGQKRDHVISHLRIEHPRSVLLFNQDQQQPKVGYGTVNGYICRPCGFLQLHQNRVTAHMMRDHPDKTGKVLMIDMSKRRPPSQRCHSRDSGSTNLHGGRQPKLRVQSKPYDVKGAATSLGRRDTTAAQFSRTSRASIWKRSLEKAENRQTALAMERRKHSNSATRKDYANSARIDRDNCRSAKIDDHTRTEARKTLTSCSTFRKQKTVESKQSDNAIDSGHCESYETDSERPVKNTVLSKDNNSVASTSCLLAATMPEREVGDAAQNKKSIGRKRATGNPALDEPPAKKKGLSTEVKKPKTPPSIAETISKLQAKLIPPTTDMPSLSAIDVEIGGSLEIPTGVGVAQSAPEFDKQLAIGQKHQDWPQRKQVLICSCLHVARTVEDFERHRLSVHRSERRFQCVECCNKFDTPLGFAEHFWTTCTGIDSRIFACAISPACLFLTSRRLKFTEHIRDCHRGEQWMPCYWCGHRYIAGESLVAHIQNNCSRKHLLKRGLKSGHVTSEEDSQDEEVEITKVVAFSPVSSVRAPPTIKPTRGDPDPSLPLRKYTKSPSNVHVVYHCSECSDEFLKSTDFIYHVTSKHPPRLRHKCHYCSFKRSSLHKLVEHIKNKHRDKPANYCGGAVTPIVQEDAPDCEPDAAVSTPEGFGNDEECTLKISAIVSLSTDETWDDLPNADPSVSSPIVEFPNPDPVNSFTSPASNETRDSSTAAEENRIVDTVGSPTRLPTAENAPATIVAAVTESCGDSPSVNEIPAVLSVPAAVAPGDSDGSGPKAYGMKIDALDKMCRMAALPCRVLSPHSMAEELLSSMLSKWLEENESRRGERPAVSQKESCEDPLAVILRLKSEPSLLEMLSQSKLVHLYKCSDHSCSFSSDSDEEFRIHLSSKLNFDGNCAYCLYCSEQHKTIDGLVSHVTQRHGDDVYQCFYCLYRTKFKINVGLHSALFHKNEQFARFYSCNPAKDVAPEPEEDPDLLALILPMVCTNGVCRFRTMDIGQFKRHIQECSAAPVAPDTHQCFHCNEVVPIASAEDHMRSHRIFNFQCRYCGHGTATGNAIVIHLCVKHPSRLGRVFLRTNSCAAAVKNVRPASEIQCNYDPVQSVAKNSITTDAVTVPAAPMRIKIEASEEPTTSIVAPVEPAPILPATTIQAAIPVFDPVSAAPITSDKCLPEPTPQPAPSHNPPNTTTMAEPIPPLLDATLQPDNPVGTPEPVPENVFTCGYQLCRFSSPNFQLLEGHLAACPFLIEGSLYCRHCFITFSGGAALFLKHMRTHQASRFTCGLCQYEANLPHYVKQHMRSAHELDICQTKCVPRCPTEADSDSGEFVFEPVLQPLRIRIMGEGVAVVNEEAGTETNSAAAAARRPSVEIPPDLCVANLNELPPQPIFPTDVRCGVCGLFATKVRVNLLRHLEQHRRDGTTSTICEPSAANTGEAPCVIDSVTSTSAIALSMLVLDVPSSPTPDTVLTSTAAPPITNVPKTAIAMVVPPLAQTITVTSAAQPLITEPPSLVPPLLPKTGKPLPPYMCQICLSYRSHSRNIMRQHLIRELNLDRYTCGLCQFNDSNEWKVRTHFYTAHPISNLSMTSSVPELAEQELERLLVAQEVESGISPTLQNLDDSDASKVAPPMANESLESTVDLEIPELKSHSRPISPMCVMTVLPLRSISPKTTVTGHPMVASTMVIDPAPVSNVAKPAETATEFPSYLFKSEPMVTEPPLCSIPKRISLTEKLPRQVITKPAETVTEPPSSLLASELMVTEPPFCSISKRISLTEKLKRQVITEPAETVTEPPSSLLASELMVTEPPLLSIVKRISLTEKLVCQGLTKPESRHRAEAGTSRRPSYLKEPDVALLPCPVCPFGNRPRVVWQQHVLNNHLHHLGFMCRLCERTFADGPQLSRHHQLMHNDQPYEGRRDNREKLDAFVNFVAHRVPLGKEGNVQERPIKLICSRNGCTAEFINLKKFYDHFVDGECGTRKERSPRKAEPEQSKVTIPTAANQETACCLCPFCNFRAKGSDKALTKRHILQHYGQRFASCFYCHEEFLSMSEVEQHCFEQHPKQPFRAKPIPIVHPVQILPVGSLELMVRSKADYAPHDPKNHRGGRCDVYSCHVCSFTTDTAGAARHHGQYAHHYAALIQLHTATSPSDARPLVPRVLCPYCAFQASDETVVKIHLARHVSLQLIKCGHCPTTFFKPIEVRRHCIKRHPRLKYKCLQGVPRILPVENWTLILIDKSVHPQHIPGGAYGCDTCEFTTDEIGQARHHGQHGHDKAAFIHYPGLRKRDAGQPVIDQASPPASTAALPETVSVSAPLVSKLTPLPQAQCTLCYIKLSGTAAWRDHAIAEHPELNRKVRGGNDGEETTFQCIRCRYLGPTMVALLRHLHTFHTNRPLAYTEIRTNVVYRCPSCTFNTISLRKARSHVIRHVFAYKCRYCAKKAQTENYILQHCRNKHPKSVPSSTANFELDAERSRLLRLIGQGVRTPCGKRTLHCLGPSEKPTKSPRRRKPINRPPRVPSTSLPVSSFAQSPSPPTPSSSSLFPSPPSSPSEVDSSNSSASSSSVSSVFSPISALLPVSSISSPSTSADSVASGSKLEKAGCSPYAKPSRKRNRHTEPGLMSKSFAALVAARKKKKLLGGDPEVLTAMHQRFTPVGSSAYGRQPEPVNWDKLKVRTHFRRLQNATMTGQHCRDVFNLFPVVLVEDFVKNSLYSPVVSSLLTHSL